MLCIGSCGEGTKTEVAIVPFPKDIDSLFKSSCALVGCHIPDDDHAFRKPLHEAGALDLSSWTGLFKCSDNGAVVISYQSKYSDLIRHVTGEAAPRMPPVGYDTVTAAEVDRLRNWIDAGAPSDDGDIPFEQVTDKIFTTNQTNDLVSVVDAASLLVMRIFEVGDIPNYTESPHGVTMSKSGEYFFVSMLGGTGKVFKYDARTGQSVGAYNLNQSQALMALSKDGTKLYVATNFLINNTGESGSISVLRASDLSLIKSIAVGQSPHGITLSRDGRLLYTMSVYQDRIYVIDTDADSIRSIFDVAHDVGPTTKYAPYHIALSVANTQGYEDFVLVSCAGTGEVRVFRRTGGVAAEVQFNLSDRYLSDRGRDLPRSAWR